MSAERSLANAGVAALFAFVLTACGGGGGGGGGDNNGNSGGNSGGNNGGNSGLVAITATNGKALTLAASVIANIGDSSVRNVPDNLVNLMAGAPQGSFDEKENCDSSGTTSYKGTLNPGGSTGNITITYNNCAYSDPYNGYSQRFNGSIRITVRASDANGRPTAYDYNYENYRYEDLSSNYSFSYSGGFSVDPDAGNTQFVANMTVTNLQTQEAISAINYASYYSLRQLYPYYPYPSLELIAIQRAGQVKHSAWGVVNLSLGFDGLRTTLSGASQSQLRVDTVLFTNSLHLALDANGDGTFESFAWVPEDALDAAPTANTSPLVIVDVSQIQPITNQLVTVPLSGISDAEYDFLTYKVQAVQTPGNANIQLALQDDSSFTLQTAAYGDYVIALTVDDGRGGVTVQHISLRVAQPAPDVLPQTSSVELLNGAIVDLNVRPTNPEAGPFTYKILSGPTGMTVDTQGNLQWQATTTFFDRLDVQAMVTVSNTDHDVTVPIQLSVRNSNQAQPIVHSGNSAPGIDKNVFVLDFNNDGSLRILLTDNNHVIRTLKYQSGTYVEDWIYPYAIGDSGTIDHILPIDTDNDGAYEIAVQIGGKIHIINEAHDAVDRSIDLNNATGYGLAAADIDNDGKLELIALVADACCSITSQGVVLDAATLAEKWRTPNASLGLDFAVGNIDNDPALELIFAGGYVYDGASQSNQWLYGSAFGNTVLAGDLDGDGIDEIFAVTLNQYGSYPTAYSGVSKSILWDISGSAYTCGIGLVQLDGDNAKEIVARECFGSSVLRAYDANNVGATQKWAVSLTRETLNFATGDVDNDGDPDLVQTVRYTNGYATQYPIVMDADSQTVLFDGADFLDGAFGGAVPANQNGVRQVLFSSPVNTGSQSGAVFLADNQTTGSTVRTPIIDSSSSLPLELCAADHDGDGSDDILFGAVENFSSAYIESYNLLSQTQQWRRTISNYYSSTPPALACGDFNNDGHTDVASFLSGTYALEINDAVNQSLIWANTLTNLTQLATGDADGDGKLELYTINSSEVKKYSPSGNSYVDSGTYPIPQTWYFMSTPQISLTDIDGDQKPEIIVIVPTNNWMWSEPVTTTVTVLNSDLSQRSTATYNGLITGIAPEHIGQGQLLVTTGESLVNSSPTRSRATVIDVASGNWIWRSPMLLGQATTKSIHYDAVAPNGGSISIGTSTARYITR